MCLWSTASAVDVLNYQYQGLVKDRDGYLPINSIESHFNSANYTNNDLILLHINTRSLIKNIDKITELLSFFPNQPDIIAISETKFKDNSNLNFAHLPGYLLFNKNSLSMASSFIYKIRLNIHW